MNKALTTILSSLAIVTCISSSFITGYAISPESGYTMNNEGIVYSLENDISDDDDVPDVGTIRIESYFLQTAMNKNPSAQFAVEIHTYVSEDGFKEEKAQFKAEHFIDGQSYAEIMEDLIYSGNYPPNALNVEQKQKVQQIVKETSAYIKTLIEEQTKYEAEWLKENGIQIIDSNGMVLYALVSREQLLNFPISTTTGYKVFLTQLENVTVSQNIEQEKFTFLIGDVTGENSVDILDVIALNKAVLGKETLTEAQLQAVDFNQNGKPDADEALTLLKYIVGLIEDFTA